MSSGGRALPEVWSRRYNDDCKTEAEALAVRLFVSQQE